MAVQDSESAARAAGNAADILTKAVNKLADDAAQVDNLAKDQATAFENAAADEIARARYKALDEINACNRAAEREAAIVQDQNARARDERKSGVRGSEV